MAPVGPSARGGSGAWAATPHGTAQVREPVEAAPEGLSEDGEGAGERLQVQVGRQGKED